MKLIKCEYCGSRIDKNDRVCPSCGANVADTIEKHYEEEEREIEEKFKKNVAMNRAMIASQSRKVYIIFAAVALFIVIITIGIFSSIYEFSSVKGTKKYESTSIKVDQEDVKYDQFSIACDNVENYVIVADHNGYDTDVEKKGFQQLAFHIVVTNLTDKTISPYSINDFVLLADGVQMKHCGVEANIPFSHEVNGKEFDKLQTVIASGASVKGWIGFYVDTTAKELELRLDNKTIMKIENPAYSG